MSVDVARKAVKDIEVQLAKEESELGKLRVSRNSMERELGKLEGIIEYLPRRRQVGNHYRQNLQKQRKNCRQFLAKKF